MGREKEKPVLDIVLDSQTLVLKGTAHDFEPTRLSGQVSLLLAEPTTLKELNLHFRGKVRFPPSASDSLIAPPPTSVVFSYDWSFLEGDKKHTRTLKAGRHLFPFSLDISGTLPSSIFTTALGGSSISYRLRAIAVRPGLAYNLQHVVPVYVVRSFTPEALEYQQTLEIENTWPDKLMYAVTLPHKAWAAGDTIVAILKFSPLVKGVAIQSIVSNLCETTKVQSRGGIREDTKVVATVKHEIVGGRAVEVDTQDIATASSSSQSIDASDIVTYIKLPLPSRCNFQTVTPVLSPVSPAFPTTSLPSDSSPSTSTPSQPLTYPIKSITPSHSVEPITVTHRIRWTIQIHNLDGHISELRCSLPVHILDGRMLEHARSCSVLTRRMVLEMVGLRAVAAELGLGTAEADANQMNGESAGGNAREADRELPSYRAHVRDRVANMFLPEAVTVRVSNPWIGRVGTGSPGDGSSPAATAEGTAAYLSRTASGTNVANLAQSLHEATLRSSSSAPLSRGPRSGRNTPGNSSLDSIALQHLPHAPVAGESTPLDWVNSELLLSLTDEPIRRLWGDQAALPTDSAAPPATTASTGNALTATESTGRGGSGWGSRAPSRHQSRNHSPERSPDVPSRPSPGSARPSLDSFERLSPPAPQHALGEVGSSAIGRPRHGHSHSSSVRNLQCLLKATMKPFTTLAGHGHASASTSPEHSRSPTPPPLPHSQSSPIVPTLHRIDSRPTAATSPCAITAPLTPAQSPPPSELSGPALLHRALTEVPDYSIASRGFIGGVPPLTSMRGLPSYEEAARSRTSMDDSDVPQVRPSAGPESAPGTPSERPMPTEDERRSSPSRERRGTSSEPDLVGLVGRGRHDTVVGVAARDVQGQHPGILQTLGTELAEASDEDGSDEGIQIHVRRRH